jgi:acyl-[acyl-carrier-protein] desaturase
VAYQRIVDELFKRDPNGTMIAFADMMKKQIVMPAHMMNDGEHAGRTKRDLFADYSSVAERVGVYGPGDYCDIMAHLNTRWAIDKQACTSGEAQEAQEFLMAQPARIRKLAAYAKKKKDAATAKTGATHEAFSWIFGRKVEIVL